MFPTSSDVEVGEDKERAEESASETKEGYEKCHYQEGTAIKKCVQSRADPHTHCDEQRWSLHVLYSTVCVTNRGTK